MKLPKLSWKKPTEIRILEAIEEHLWLCIAATDELALAIEAKMAIEIMDPDAHIENVSIFEKKADEARRLIIEYLAQGVLPPLNRIDLMNLVERLDEIADWAREAGQILAIVPTEEFNEKLKERFREFNKKSNLCAHALSLVVQLLYKDIKKALDECRKVELYENKVDRIFIDTLQCIYESNLLPNTMILTNELARSLEMMADSCENASDWVRIVAISTFH